MAGKLKHKKLYLALLKSLQFRVEVFGLKYIQHDIFCCIGLALMWQNAGASLVCSIMLRSLIDT